MLPERLSKLRIEHKKTQQEMADMLGITRPAYTAYESGKRKPDYETLQRLADFFEVSTDYLLGRIDDPTPLTRSNDLYIAYRHGKKSIEVETDEEAEYLKEELEKFRAWKAAKARERQRDN